MKKIKITHFGLHTPVNAGDTMLFKVTQKIFLEQQKKSNFSVDFVNFSVHQEVTQKIVDQANESDLILVGGGGLFLRDTKANENSGWQWNLPISLIPGFKKPIAIFGIGYNRFRGQKEFDPIFKKHLNCLVNKSSFFGLRNYGSIDRIRAYLSSKLREKVTYQPCPTTLLSRISLENLGISKPKNNLSDFSDKIILNIPFDRAEMRYGKHKDRVLEAVAKAMKDLSQDYQIELVFHCSNDINLTLDMEKQEVKYSTVHLESTPYEKILNYYYDNRNALIISGRGHGQMIPFGWNSLFLSLISHNKLKYFLEDTSLHDLGQEIIVYQLRKKIVDKVKQIIKNRGIVRQRIEAAQSKLLQITESNINCLLDLASKS